MKRLWLIIIVETLFLYNSSGQTVSKPVIDETALQHWTSVSPGNISDDGKYVAYSIDNKYDNLKSVIFQSTDGKWKKEITNCKLFSRVPFAGKCKYGLASKGSDTLVIITLGTGVVRTLARVNFDDQLAEIPENWIVQRHSKNHLTFQNFVSGRKYDFDNIKEFIFYHDGKNVLLEKDKDKKTKLNALTSLNLSSGKVTNVWTGNGDVIKVLGPNDDVLLFVKSNLNVGCIWYITKTGVAKQLISDSLLSHKNLILSPTGLKFSNNGDKVIFSVVEKPVSLPNSPSVESKTSKANVTIWSYQDKPYMAKQIAEKNRKNVVLGQRNIVMDLSTNAIASLDVGDDVVSCYNNNIWVMQKFDPEQYSGIGYILNIQTNHKTYTQKLDRKRFTFQPFVSPDERFVLMFDAVEAKWWKIDLETGTGEWLYSDSTISLGSKDLVAIQRFTPGSIISFEKKSNSVYLNDTYGDIWRFSLSDRLEPVNITSYYGYQNNLVFSKIVSPNIIRDSRLLLKGFNPITKVSGYYLVNLAKLSKPKLLSQTSEFFDTNIYESKFKKGFLVTRMSASHSPNLFFSSDLTKFVRLSNVFPEKNYNWLDADLLTWIGFDNQPTNGILYKPENFDPLKKYPLILHYYERMSDGINSYMRPEYTYGAINIPWFVSRGYLICCVDIKIVVGETGKSALKSISRAADYLSKLGYVDSTKIGLQGHSFGGYLTNYIISHTNRFAAAQTGAGPSDIVSMYTDIYNKVQPMSQLIFENGQMRMGKSLWEIPMNYIENSPIMSANHVVTPLLLMHNRGDSAVPFGQGVGMFNALRRLQKPVWLLDYEGSGHLIIREEDQKDFTIRLEQFFDHYLKNKPAPPWMTESSLH